MAVYRFEARYAENIGDLLKAGVLPYGPHWVHPENVVMESNIH